MICLKCALINFIYFSVEEQFNFICSDCRKVNSRFIYRIAQNKIETMSFMDDNYCKLVLNCVVQFLDELNASITCFVYESM